MFRKPNKKEMRNIPYFAKSSSERKLTDLSMQNQSAYHGFEDINILNTTSSSKKIRVKTD